jgi:hypothetical protein
MSKEPRITTESAIQVFFNKCLIADRLQNDGGRIFKR